VVDDESESFGQLELSRHFTGNEDEVTEDCLVLRRGFADARYHFFRHDQEVHRSLRLNVMEHDAMFILVFDPGGDFAGGDFLKDRLAHDEVGWEASGQQLRFACKPASYRNSRCRLDPRTVRAAASSRMNASASSYSRFRRAVARPRGGISAGRKFVTRSVDSR
jgi:hypothetical protein